MLERLRDHRLLLGGALAASAVIALASWPRAGEQPSSAPLLVPPGERATAPPPAAAEPPPPAVPAVGVEGLRLHGVTASGAIIGFPGGIQRLVRLGRDVLPGLTLREVRQDRAVLASAGGQVELGFTGPVPPGRSPAVAAAPAPSRAVEARREETLRYRFGLEPRRAAGRITGFAIRPGAELPLLRRAGLQPGDLLVSVNGQTFDSQERVEELASEIAGSFAAEIEFERNGRRVRTSLQVNPRS